MPTKETTYTDRLFRGIYPGGVVYADRKREEFGDYKRLGFFAWSTGTLDVRPDCPKDLRVEIEADAKQYKRGDVVQISTSGQTIRVGPALPPPPSATREDAK